MNSTRPPIGQTSFLPEGTAAGADNIFTAEKKGRKKISATNLVYQTFFVRCRKKLLEKKIARQFFCVIFFSCLTFSPKIVFFAKQKFQCRNKFSTSFLLKFFSLSKISFCQKNFFMKAPLAAAADKKSIGATIRIS